MRLVRGRDRGSSAVEFALVFPILALIMFGVVQYGWYFYVAEATSGAASNVARRLAVGDCWSSTQARDLAKQQAPYLTSVSKTPADLTTAVVGTTQVVFTVTSDANIIGFFPMPDGGVVTRTVKTRLEDKTASGTCP